MNIDRKYVMRSARTEPHRQFEQIRDKHAQAPLARRGEIAIAHCLQFIGNPGARTLESAGNCQSLR